MKKIMNIYFKLFILKLIYIILKYYPKLSAWFESTRDIFFTIVIEVFYIAKYGQDYLSNID